MSELSYQTLSRRVALEWDPLPIPAHSQILTKGAEDPAFTGSFGDGQTIKHWLLGKKYHEIIESPEFQVELPFHYLSSTASTYYIGGYIKSISDELLENKRIDFDLAEVHLGYYLSGIRLMTDINGISPGRIRIIAGIIDLFLTPDFVMGAGTTPERKEMLERNRQSISRLIRTE